MLTRLRYMLRNGDVRQRIDSKLTIERRVEGAEFMVEGEGYISKRSLVNFAIDALQYATTPEER